MKRIIFIVLAAFASCGQGQICPVNYPKPPVLPAGWEEILGEPFWRLEWVDGGGNWASWEGKEGFPALALTNEWVTPVLAWPFWPEKGIIPGVVRPAGALFPWDSQGENLVLRWEQGVDTYFWRELAENGNREAGAGTPRFPWLFDWPRFRELMESEDIPEDVRQDPWTADWKTIAQKTAESGFDRRRIKAEDRKEVSIPCHAALWIGSSPFAEPVQSTDKAPAVFFAGETPETWFSALGLLRIQKEAWVFIPWD